MTDGTLNGGDEIEIRPGANINNKWTPLRTKLAEIIHGSKKSEKAKPGGLVALQTELDPALTRGDGLAGSIAGYPEYLPPVYEELKLNISLFDYVIGVGGHQNVPSIKVNNPLMLTAGIAKTVGIVTNAKKSAITIKLKIPVCAEKNDKVAVAMQVSGRWHLVGYGVIS